MIENYEPWMDAVIFVTAVFLLLAGLLWWGRRFDRARGVPSCVDPQPSHVKLIEPVVPAHDLPWPLDVRWEERYRADAEGEVIR